MTPNTIVKIVSTALHPGTDIETAVAAFRQLHRNASKFGGLSSVLGGGGADLWQRLTRAQNEAIELRAKLSSTEERLHELKCEHDGTVLQMRTNREDAEDAEARCDQKQQRIAVLEMELADLKANGAGDELGIIAQHHTQIEALGRIDIQRSQIMAAARWTKPAKWTVRRS